MCWETEDELYNDGRAFKVCARDARGVIVTVIADNYFGYCKKEVKTQISLLRQPVRQRRGGALRRRAGVRQLQPRPGVRRDVLRRRTTRWPTCSSATPSGSRCSREGHADRPRAAAHRARPRCGAHYSMRDMTGQLAPARRRHRVGAPARGQDLPEPERLPGDRGAAAARPEHLDASSAPCRTRRRATSRPPSPVAASRRSPRPSPTRSSSARRSWPTSTPTWTRSPRSSTATSPGASSTPSATAPTCARSCRATARSGPSSSCSPRRARSTPPTTTPGSSRIPPYVKELVYVVKRSYRPEWGDDWRSHFSVAEINGRQGNSLHLDGTKVTLNMLRVGYEVDGSWRLFSLRHDFSPAVKVQTEDDITASTVVPGAPPGARPGTLVQARRELREPALPAPRRRDPPRLRHARPSATSPPPAPSCPTSSR